MCPQSSSGASPEQSMEEVTERSLTLGAIQEAVDDLEIEDLQRVCEFAASLAGRSEDESRSMSGDELRESFKGSVEYLRDNEPSKLAEVAKFVDGIAREQYKQTRARFRRSA